MKTNTFADLLEMTHPPRKCYKDFICLSVKRLPTEKELRENTNLIFITEPELFFYWRVKTFSLDTGF